MSLKEGYGRWPAMRSPHKAIGQQAEHLSPVERPKILRGEIDELSLLLAVAGEAALRFDIILGRNSLTQHPNKAEALRVLAALLADKGQLSLAEALPRAGQRLYRLVNLAELGPELAQAVMHAEEAIYANTQDPMTNWDTGDLQTAAQIAGLQVGNLEMIDLQREQLITPEQVAVWFKPGSERPSYADHLQRTLDAASVETVRRLFVRQLAGRAVPWHSQVVLLSASQH